MIERERLIAEVLSRHNADEESCRQSMCWISTQCVERLAAEIAAALAEGESPRQPRLEHLVSMCKMFMSERHGDDIDFDHPHGLEIFKLLDELDELERIGAKIGEGK